MSNNIDNIIFSKSKSNPTVDTYDALYNLEYYRTNEYLAPLENFVPFIKNCESLCRKSLYYKKYIHYIKEEVGLTACQVLGNVQEVDPSDNLIEMHHGPLLTLFDYCTIITNYLLYNRYKFNEFTVAKMVMEEHYNNRVEVIMVCETVHDLLHSPGGPFVELDQGFGDVYGFLKKYKNGLDSNLIYKINRYYDKSVNIGTQDYKLFEINNFANKMNDSFDFK